MTASAPACALPVEGMLRLPPKEFENPMMLWFRNTFVGTRLTGLERAATTQPLLTTAPATAPLPPPPRICNAGGDV